MRRTFGTIALLTALASGQACLAQQQDQQQLQQQQDRQQRDVEQGLTSNAGPYRQDYRTMASDARRNAEKAKTPASKERWLKMAKKWDDLAVQDQHLQSDR